MSKGIVSGSKMIMMKYGSNFCTYASCFSIVLSTCFLPSNRKDGFPLYAGDWPSWGNNPILYWLYFQPNTELHNCIFLNAVVMIILNDMSQLPHSWIRLCDTRYSSLFCNFSTSCTKLLVLWSWTPCGMSVLSHLVLYSRMMWCCFFLVEYRFQIRIFI